MMVIAALAIASIVLGVWKGVAFDPSSMVFPLVFSFVFIALGQYYRIFRDGERIALMAIVIGLFAPWSFVASIFNILLLPRQNAAIDPLLVQWDAMLGYSWPEFCAWYARYPMLADITRSVYNLTLAQLLFTVMFLGLANDRQRLHTVTLALIFASLVTLFFWALFPSNGASAYWTLDPEIDRLVQPVVDSAYGAELKRQLVESVTAISQIEAKGMIAFPSFHTIMALMTLIAVWPYMIPRVLLLGINAILFPGILVFGGHHLMDVFGGVAATIVCWFVAVRVYRAQEAHELTATNAISATPAAATAS